MRVSLFGLFLRCTNLVEPWSKLVRLVLLVFNFIRFYQFYVSLGDIWGCIIYYTSRLFNFFCMRMLTTRFLIHAYDLDLLIHECLSLHTTWHSQHHSLESSVSLGSSCLGFGSWSRWTLPVTDQSGAAEAWIIGRPSRALSFQAPC